MTQSRPQRDFAARVRALTVPEGHLAIWALGQQGYLLKGGAHTLVIDAYLSDAIERAGGPSKARQVPCPVAPAALDMVTLALATHYHEDHCDPETLLPLLGAAPAARVLTSWKSRDALQAAGLDPARITVPPIDTPVSHGAGLTVTAIPSAHYGFEPDAEGRPAFLGFILEINGVTLYHAGDGVIYDGLLDRLRRQPLDLVCLPINGRDWFREQEGLVGNMDYREAADLTAALGGPTLIAGHNDMFAGNRINPATLLDYLTTRHPGQRAQFLQAGELYYYAG